MAGPFEAAGFLRHTDAGGVMSATNDHVVVVPDQFPLWIQDAVEQLHPEQGGGAVLYRVGEVFGQMAFGMLARALTGESADAAELSPQRFSEILGRCTAALGWGEMSLRPEEDWLFVDLRGSVIQRALGGAHLGKPSHSIYAGFVAGLLGQVGGKRLTVVEAPGQPEPGVIRFRVHPAEDMDGTEFWGQYGVRMPELTFHIREAARRRA
ncbi:MAG TPA: hypothetical protein VG389_16675 [Myxococcota bacterium]|jgi:predicted hydrocarbon binding protein|nr:hypothetical protein [Myxococcota bacterium]